MLIKEYRIVLPITVEEYKVGHTFCTNAFPCEINIDDNVEVILNETLENYPLMGGQYASGQFKYKIHDLDISVPFYLRFMRLKRFFELHEEVWDAYPYRKVILTNPGFMKNNFLMSAEVMNCPDRGTQENIFDLSPKKLAMRQVVYIDIANDRIAADKYVDTEDPNRYKSERTGRGPLMGYWKDSVVPVMCSYRLVTTEFKWLGLQGIAEGFLQSKFQEVYLKFHRQLFCSMDHWFGLTDGDIGRLARKTNNIHPEKTSFANVKYIYSNFAELFFQ